MAGEEKHKGYSRVKQRRVDEYLRHFAFEVLKLSDLVLHFGALSHNFESKAVREHNNQAHDFMIIVVGGHLRNEDPVNFQGIDREARQAAERRVAGAKIVDA